MPLINKCFISSLNVQERNKESKYEKSYIFILNRQRQYGCETSLFTVVRVDHLFCFDNSGQLILAKKCRSRGAKKFCGDTGEDPYGNLNLFQGVHALILYPLRHSGADLFVYQLLLYALSPLLLSLSFLFLYSYIFFTFF